MRKNMLSEPKSWRAGTVIVKALAMTVPWGVVEVGIGKSGFNFGYYVGLAVGIIVFCIVPPREKHPWKWLVGGVVLATIHYLIPREWR
jgi:uncharacterized BrkB/YihY/UPF0761 family membrane protein